jgi:hypothetical protein
MNKNRADILSDYVFGNRRLLVDALEDQVKDMNLAEDNRDKLSYLAKTKVTPKDIGTVLSETVVLEDLQKASNDAIRFRGSDIAIKKAEYEASLKVMLVRVCVAMSHFLMLPDVVLALINIICRIKSSVLETNWLRYLPINCL